MFYPAWRSHLRSGLQLVQAYHPPSAFFLRYRLTFAKLYNFFKVPPGTPDPKRPDILKDAFAKTLLAPYLAKKLYVPEARTMRRNFHSCTCERTVRSGTFAGGTTACWRPTWRSTRRDGPC